MKSAAAYVRVSTDEQTDGWSLDGQEIQIREYAARNNYQIVQVYHDETSGSKDANKRPGLERMLMDAQAGLFTAVIVVHTSRLFRNLALARKYKEMLREKLSIELIFLNQPAIDPNDPSAFILEGFNELFDEYYLHQLRFWTSLGKQTRAQQGMWNGTLPFGYRTGENGEPVAHPENAEGLRLAFESYATDRYSDQQVAELLNREGFRTSGNWGERLFTKDTVNRMLQNVFYLGLVKYKGQTYPGKHPALIEQELFDRCQEVRVGRARRSRALGVTRSTYIFAGLARCSVCGLTLRAYSTKSKGRWQYYRHVAESRGLTCAIPTISVRAVDLESQWTAIISSIELPADWRERIEELVSDVDQRQAILREREQVQERLRRVKTLYRDGLMDDEEYRPEADRLQNRLAALVLPVSQELISAGEYLENLSGLWADASPEEKQAINRLMLKSVIVDVEQGRIVVIEPTGPFRSMLMQVSILAGVEVR